MKNWWLPENRTHTVALALAVTLICVLTFIHGCASRTCEMVLDHNGTNIHYVCH